MALNRSNSGSVHAGEDAAEKQQAFSLCKASWKEVTCMFKHNDSASSFNNQINASEIGNQVWEALTLKAGCQLSYFLAEAEHFQLKTTIITLAKVSTTITNTQILQF